VAVSWLYSAQRQHALAHTTYLCGGLGRQRCGKLMRGATRRAPSFSSGYPSAPRRRGSGRAAGPQIGSLGSRCTSRTLFSLLCHSGPFYGIEIRRPDFYLPHLLQKGAHIYYRFRSKFLGERAVQFYFTFQSAPPSFHNSTRAEATLVLFCSKRTRHTSS
jgi:hypothetical protein